MGVQKMSNVMTIPVKEEGKRKQKGKKAMAIPTIQRSDIMSGLLSPCFNSYERSQLSNLYAEITYMEKSDLKYISEIAVSSQSDMEIYEMLNRMKKATKEQQV